VSSRICELVSKSALYHKRLMTRMLERFDVTYAQYQVLKVIKQHQPLSAKEILVHLDTDKATLSGVLSRLEQRGYIQRDRDRSDKRVLHVRLTRTSSALLEAIEVKETECTDSLTHNIKNRELKNFFNVFERIINNQLRKIDEIEQEQRRQSKEKENDNDEETPL